MSLLLIVFLVKFKGYKINALLGSKFEDLNLTLGKTQSVASYFKPRASGGVCLDDTAALSPTTRPRSPSPFEDEDDMAADDSIELNRKDRSMSKSQVVASPAYDKMTSCAPTRQGGAERAEDKVIHRRVVAAPRSSPSVGSFFQRKLAQMREGQLEKEEEEKEAAKLEGELLSKNDAGTAAPMALGDTANSVTETTSAMTSEAVVTSASSAKMATTSSATVIAASTSTLSASSSVGSSSVTSFSSVTSSPSVKSSSSVTSSSRLVAEEEECGIDMGELIPNLENFDPAILDILPHRFR